MSLPLPTLNPLSPESLFPRATSISPETEGEVDIIDSDQLTEALAQAVVTLSDCNLLDNHTSLFEIVDFETYPGVAYELLFSTIDEMEIGPPQWVPSEDGFPDWVQQFDLAWSMFGLTYFLATNDGIDPTLQRSMVAILQSHYARYEYEQRPVSPITCRIWDFVDERLFSGDPTVTQMMIPILFAISVDKTLPEKGLHGSEGVQRVYESTYSGIFHSEKDHEACQRTLGYFEAILKGEITIEDPQIEALVLNVINQFVRTVTTMHNVLTRMELTGRDNLASCDYLSSDALRVLLPRGEMISDIHERHDRFAPLVHNHRSQVTRE